MQVVAYALHVSVLSTIMVNHILSQDILRPVGKNFNWLGRALVRLIKRAKRAR